MNDDGSHADDDPTHDGDAQWHQLAQRHYDPERDAELTTAIVYTVADAKEIEPNQLKSPLLYDVVDVPAIETAFFEGSANGDSPPGTGTVEFRFDGHLVKIRSDGWIQVYGTSERTES